MKALKVLGAILATLVLAVAVVWFAWLSPPSPESVCDNLARLQKKEAGVEMTDKARTQCLESAAKAPEFGRAPWVKRLKCYRDAQSLAELKSCDDKGA
jgi:hypothetical protein